MAIRVRLRLIARTFNSHNGHPVASASHSWRWAKKGKQQLFVMDMRGGEAQDVTESDQGIVRFCWAPDGRSLGFTSAAPSREKEEDQQHNKAFEVTRNSYLADAPDPPIHLWILDLEQRDARQLTSGTESVVSPWGIPFDFSPDGNSLVYVARPAPDDGYFNDLTLRLIDVSSREMKTLVSHPSNLGVPRFSPDGKLVSYIAPRGGEPLFTPFSVFTVPVSTGQPVDAVSKLDRSIIGSWIPRSRTLLLTGANLTKNSAWVHDLDATPKLLDLGDVHIESRHPSVSNSGVIAFCRFTTRTADRGLSTRLR